MPIFLRDVLENPAVLTSGTPPTSMSGDGPDHPMDPELDAYYKEVGERMEAERPACSTCGVKMTLVEWERPGSPPGNGWRCLTCNSIEATEAEAAELFAAGWVPDVAGGRTHWLHAELAAVLGVSTKKALERQRRR
jgi:hypothetical protein